MSSVATRSRRQWAYAVAWAVLIVSLFGATDEFHQHFTPGRSMDVLDWLADTCGAVVAVAAYTFWPGYRRPLKIALLKQTYRSDPIDVAAKAAFAS